MTTLALLHALRASSSCRPSDAASWAGPPWEGWEGREAAVDPDAQTRSLRRRRRGLASRSPEARRAIGPLEVREASREAFLLCPGRGVRELRRSGRGASRARDCLPILLIQTKHRLANRATGNTERVSPGWAGREARGGSDESPGGREASVRRRSVQAARRARARDVARTAVAGRCCVSGGALCLGAHVERDELPRRLHPPRCGRRRMPAGSRHLRPLPRMLRRRPAGEVRAEPGGRLPPEG